MGGGVRRVHKAHRTGRGEVGAIRCEVEDVPKIKCRQLEVVAIDFVPRFFRLSVPAVVGGVVEDVRTGQNKKKNVALTQGGKDGGEEGYVPPKSHAPGWLWASLETVKSC